MDSIAAIGTAVVEPSLQPTASMQALANGAAVAGTNPVSGAGFSGLVTQGLQEVDRQLAASQVDLQKLATGEAQNLHQIMIRMEESRLSFQLLMQARNRLLESYQEVMRMSV